MAGGREDWDFLIATTTRHQLTDGPGPFRAFVPLVNNDAFQAAFNIQPADRMYRAPGERVRI